MPLSVMTNHRIGAVHGLESFFTSYADTLGSQLSQDLEPLLEPGESMPDVELTLRLLGRLLGQKRDALDHADRRRADAEAALDAHRRHRDDNAKRLRRQFVGMRETLRAFYGDAGLQATGLGRKVARQPFELWASCQHVLRQAPKADLAQLDATFTGGGPTAEHVTVNLTASTHALGDALQAVDAGIRDVDTARARKKSASEDLETTYVGLGELAQALCRLSGQPKLAHRTHRPLRDLDRKRRASQDIDEANVHEAREAEMSPPESKFEPREAERDPREHENEPRAAELTLPGDANAPRASEPTSSSAAIRANRRKLTPPSRLDLARKRRSTPSNSVCTARKSSSTASEGARAAF